MFERRLRLVATAGAVFFLGLLGTLFYMQVVRGGEFRREARELGVRNLTLRSHRGAILDRNGRTLAADRLQWDLEVRFDYYEGSSWICAGCGRPAVTTGSAPPRRCPACHGREFTPGPPRDLGPLCAALGMSRQDFAAALGRAREEMRARLAREIARKERHHLDVDKKGKEEERARFAGWSWTAVENVGPAAVREVSEHPRRYRGLSLAPEWRRVVTASPEAASLVGKVGPLWEEEGQRLVDAGERKWSEVWRMRVGRSGLEKAFEKDLRARDGQRSVYRDVDGELRVVPGETPAEDGRDVRTSIDSGLQACAAAALKRAGEVSAAGYGAFVAMDPSTGEVLAIVSWSKRDDGIFYPLAGLQPGSVFKVVTTIAGLESGSLDPDRIYDCPGVYHGIHCHNGEAHGPIDLRRALAVSCNGYFARAAEQTGITILDDWAKRLGFAGTTGIEIDGESPGLVASPEFKLDRHERAPKDFPDSEWYAGDTRQIGFGQGMVQVTPLQVARLMAMVANGGRPIRPTLRASGGSPGAPILSPDTVRRLREGLGDVVRRGTAAKTDLARFGAAGKTGTADLPHGRGNMAWFAGYAPEDRPRVAFAACLGEVPTYGAGTAGPVVSAFLDEFLRR